MAMISRDVVTCFVLRGSRASISTKQQSAYHNYWYLAVTALPVKMLFGCKCAAGKLYGEAQ